MQGAKPDSHFEHDALHCPCHHEFEEEHICHIVSASLHSFALLISSQLWSQLPGDSDDVGGGEGVQGVMPESHLEQVAWHCLCHQEFEEEHICH